MMAALAPRDRRAVVVGGAIAAAVLGWTGLVRPYRDAVEQTATMLQRERALLEREEGIVLARDDYPRIERSARVQLADAASRFWMVADAGIAHASLASYLQQWADSNRVLVTQVEAVAPVPLAAGIVGIPLRVHGETDVQGLVDYLAFLTAGPKLVRLDQLEMVATAVSDRSTTSGPPAMPVARTGPFAGPAVSTSEVISFQLTAVGYLIPAPPSADRSTP